jgi:pimeloyl-ACP methyl ester carboxylesterase
LYSHGNAEDLGAIAAHIQSVADALDTSVFAYEYLGYGFSEGRKVPTEKGCYESIDMAYSYLRYALNYNTTDIIVLGRSIGCGPTVDLASREIVNSVILISPFRTAIRTQIDYGPLNPIGLLDIFRNESKIGMINSPILFIHGLSDTIIPPIHTQKLADCAYGKPEVQYIKNTGHNDIWNPMVEQIIMEFIQDEGRR